MKKGIIAVFDFDGTLTKKDTFIEFARHCVGWNRLLWGMIRCLPWLIVWKSKILDGGKVKQRLFSLLYKGMDFSTFQNYCNSFIPFIKDFERKEIVEKLNYHLHRHHKVYIISASINDWIAPWAFAQGLQEKNVIGTGIEVDNVGKLTGRFSTPNCRGMEKVRRLKEAEPDFPEHELFVYGDSSGDHELLTIADHPEIIK